MLNFSSSFVSRIRRFSSNRISLWGLFLVFRNSSISALDSSGFLPKTKKKLCFFLGVSVLGVWVYGDLFDIFCFFMRLRIEESL